MVEETKKEKTHQIEELILQLPEVINCKIVNNDQGEIIEVHILSSNKRTPKQIARDVLSSLMAKWGIEIDHKIISIAQISNDLEEFHGSRLQISKVEYSLEGIIANAQVVLTYEDKIYKGEEEGLHTKKSYLMLIANATLRAVEEYLGVGRCFIIEDVEKTLLAKKKIITIAITLLTPNEEKQFLGSSYIGSNENKAVVKATLNALNRLIQKH